MTFNPNPPLGAAPASSSLPVVLATDQVGDVLITGAVTTGALGNNILLAVEGVEGIDCMAPSATYRSFAAQINGASGITTGAVTFEESNDGTYWAPINAYSDGGIFTSTPNAAITIQANNRYFFSGRIRRRYFRCRVSTAFAGGSVQAFTKFSSLDVQPSTMVVAQGNPWSMTTMSTISALPTPNNHVAVTTASTNATYIGSSRQMHTAVFSNVTATPAYIKIYNKGSAPTVGTDVPVMTIPLAAYSTFVENFAPVGVRFTAGLAYAVTGGIDATDTSNAPAGVQVSIGHI